MNERNIQMRHDGIHTLLYANVYEGFPVIVVEWDREFPNKVKGPTNVAYLGLPRKPSEDEMSLLKGVDVALQPRLTLSTPPVNHLVVTLSMADQSCETLNVAFTIS